MTFEHVEVFMRFSRSTALLFLFLSACNPDPKPLDGPVSEGDSNEVVADRLCFEYEECRCGELAGVSLKGCETGMQFSWAARREDAKEQGLIYDGDCLTKRLNAMLERGCEAASLGTTIFCSGFETCLIYHGTKKEGEECEGGVSTADCEQGLVCLGTCQKPCANTGFDIAEGEVCRDEEIDFYGVCADQLQCDFMTGRCAGLPGAGDPCVNGLCAEGLWCSPLDGATAVCTETVGLGGDCQLPQQCDTYNCGTDQKCAAAPSAGEQCFGKCSDDLVCGLADAMATMLTCIPLPQNGDPCLTNVVERCAADLTCADGTCVPKPGEGESCEPGADMIPIQCAGELICGAKLCSLDRSVPGCDRCASGDETCIARICSPIPPAVCGDSGGLLY